MLYSEIDKTDDKYDIITIILIICFLIIPYEKNII